MAEKEVPEGLDAIGRDLLGTDRIIVEKNRATLAELLVLVDSEFALTDLAADFATAQGAITAAEGDIDDLEARADALELIAAQTHVVTASSDTVPAGTTDVLILTSGAVALQMQTVVDTGRVRIHTHSGTGAVTLSRSAADATASGVFQSASGTANTCVLSAPNVFRQGRTWSLIPKIQGVPTWYVMDGESLSADDAAARVTIAENDILALDTRVDTLEAPTSVDANSGSISWTTVKRYRNILIGLATFTLNATTGQWPVGESRILANFSSGAGGIALAVPSGHYLNTVLNGVSGTLDAAGVADDGKAMYSILVTREDTDKWSWS